MLIPAWYGMGSALEEFAGTVADGWEKLVRMYGEWAFFRGTVENAILALAKADMEIAHCYAGLMDDPVEREAIWQRLDEEYRKTRQAVLRMSGREALLEDIPWLRHSIEERNPHIDPLNLIQVELLRRMRVEETRGEPQDEDVLRDLLRLSIQRISAGMRNTG